MGGMGKDQRIGLDTIGGARAKQTPQPEPAETPEPVAAVPEPAKAEEPLQGTRWLYDSDHDYERAQKKLATEIALEKKKKELAKKVRSERAKRLAGTFRAKVKPAVSQVVPKTLAIARKGLARKHRKKVLIGAAGLAVALFFAWSSQSNLGKPSTQVLGQSAAPTFNTLLPGDDAKQTTSGQVAYDRDKKVASFTDTIDEIPLTVSQQALPERFKKDPATEISKFAADINANEKLQIGSLTAYSGVSEKGPQTVVFIKNDVLVFVTASKKLPTAQLIGYIDSLK
jgi:hypothetical protein